MAKRKKNEYPGLIWGELDTEEFIAKVDAGVRKMLAKKEAELKKAPKKNKERHQNQKLGLGGFTSESTPEYLEEQKEKYTRKVG